MNNRTPSRPRTYGLFIDGKSVDAREGRTYERHDPFDGSLVATYADADAADVDLAVQSARAQFESGAWRYAPARERAKVLKAAAALVRERADTITDVATRELGQPGVARTVARAAESMEYFGFLATELGEEALTEQAPDALGIVAREPIGVAGILSAWNTPLAIGHKAIPALAVGCSVVVKPAHQTAGAVVEIAQLLAEAGVPPGAFNVVTSSLDNGAVAGGALSSHADVDMISFTGSMATARSVVANSASNLKKLTLELGGKSPNVVFADVGSITEAVDAACLGITHASGQSCQAGSRLLVQESIKDEFIELLQRRFAEVRLGDPFDRATTMGPLISPTHLERVESYVKAGKRAARLLVGGERAAGPGLASGYFFEPTMFDAVPLESSIAEEEIFGPVLCVLPFRDFDEAVSIANRTVYGLAAAVWSSDMSVAWRFAKRLRAGTVWVNTYRGIDFPTMPMGGYKQSGVGRSRGRSGLDNFLESKSILIRV